ncbi:MAG: hypothetical protein AAF039_05295 [Bacteroidota bacterium]
MHKILVFISFLLFSQFGASQKLIEKTLLNPKTRYIQIDGSECFQLVLNTHQSDLLKVEASMEGQYAKDLVIKLEEDGKNIGISVDLLPGFKSPHIKFSVHKVISIVLHVTLPEHMTASVYGTHTNVTGEGTYKDLSITLSDGNCTLYDISGKTSVKTQTGEIVVNKARGVVTTRSIYGKIKKGAIPSGDETYSLQSVEGSIIVNVNNG